MDVNGKVHMVQCVQMVANFKLDSYGLQLITIVQLHSHNTKHIIVNEPLCLIIVLDLTLWFYGTLSSLFHAFRVYSLRLILLKGVGTFTKVNN